MQPPIKPQLDKRLHFPFSEGSHAASTDRPPTHNCTLKISYRTGGNNQLGPQKEAHQQFRYSAARDQTHCPVHPSWHPRLLRKRRTRCVRTVIPRPAAFWPRLTKRKPVVSKYVHFDSISNIATRYSFTESKVKNLLYHSRNRLRSYLKKEIFRWRKTHA